MAEIRGGQAMTHHWLLSAHWREWSQGTQPVSVPESMRSRTDTI